jgi:hemoglobin
MNETIGEPASMPEAESAMGEERYRFTPYGLVGGEEGVRRLVDRFYEIMDEEPAAAGIRAMHGADLAPIRQRFFEFMSAWLGGPQTYFERADRPCIRSAHRPYPIGPAERDQWLMCMHRALAEVGASEETRRLLEQPLLRMADMLRSR